MLAHTIIFGKLLPMSKSRLFEGEMPDIFIVMVELQNILSYSPRSNSVEGQMSKSLDSQIPQIANSYYLCMVICLKVKVHSKASGKVKVG